ncbi:MAG: hypothetical protein Q4A41_05935 [Bacillota bacterium]|nr:hypothetical protein [Bacillota bacterium]
MKKNTQILLIMLTVLCLILASCGNKEGTGPSESSAPSTSGESEQAIVNKSGPAQDALIFENKVCTLKVKNMTPNENFGYTIDLTLQNKLPNDTIYLSVSSFINGIGNSWPNYRSVEPNQETEIRIDLEDFSPLKQFGVKEIGDIELAYRISYITNKEIIKDSYHIYPLGEDKKARHERNVDTDIVLIDNESVKIRATGIIDYSAIGTLAVEMYMENKTETPLEVVFHDVFLNNIKDKKIGDTYRFEVHPGRALFAELYFASDDVSALKAQEITEIDASFMIVDQDNKIYGQGKNLIQTDHWK